MRSIRPFVSVLILLTAVSAFAQVPAPQPPQLTWVRFFDVDFAKGEEWAAYQKQSTGAVFDRLIAEGKIVAWGMGTPFVMSGQNWTHAIWATLPKWSAADDINAGFESAMSRMTPAERDREMQMMGAVKSMPRDVILRHLVQSMTPPASTAPPRYVRISYYMVNPGRSEDAVSLFREVVEGPYTDLAKRGVIGAWGFSTQELVTDPSWTHMIWFFTNDLSRFDDVRNSMMTMGREARQTTARRLNEMTDPTKVRQEVLRVLELKVAPPRPPSR